MVFAPAFGKKNRMQCLFFSWKIPQNICEVVSSSTMRAQKRFKLPSLSPDLYAIVECECHFLFEGRNVFLFRQTMPPPYSSSGYSLFPGPTMLSFSQDMAYFSLSKSDGGESYSTDFTRHGIPLPPADHSRA